MPKSYHFVDARQESETIDWLSRPTRCAGGFVDEGPLIRPSRDEAMNGGFRGGRGWMRCPIAAALDPLEDCLPARTLTTQMLNTGLSCGHGHLISSDLLVALPATEALECWGGLDMVRSRGAQARRWNAPGT